MLKSRLPQIALQVEILVEEAIEEGAEHVAAAARQRVRVASGKLRDAIHTDDQDEGVYVVAGDTDAWYGHLVEHGTAHTSPHPFLVPSLEENRDTVTGMVRASLRGL